MATLQKGWTFAQSELVTAAKLNSLVDDATFWGVVTVATNASIPNIATGTLFKLYHSTYGSIASFTGMVSGQQFTLVAQQASFPVIVDNANFVLAGNWIPSSTDDAITLVWDGTKFIEISRVNS